MHDFHYACHDRAPSNCSNAPHFISSIHHPTADSDNRLNELLIPCHLQQIDAEATKTRANYAAQQATVGSLEARCTYDRTATERHSRPLVAARSNKSPISAMRSLVKQLRVEGVCVHGMLADLVLLRREHDRKAVTAVIGSALWTAVVVQARGDGARVVAGARAAGITGKVRCDVLDEMEETIPMATGGSRQGNVGSGLVALQECVATANPLHFPAAVKYLRGWYVHSKHEPSVYFSSRSLVGAVCRVVLLTISSPSNMETN